MMLDAFISTSNPYVRYDSQHKNLMIKSAAFNGKFPWEIQVESEKTGRVVRFVKVQPGDFDFNEDQWDGEMSIYKTVEGEEPTHCRRLIVYHG